MCACMRVLLVVRRLMNGFMSIKEKGPFTVQKKASGHSPFQLVDLTQDKG